MRWRDAHVSGVGSVIAGGDGTGCRCGRASPSRSCVVVGVGLVVADVVIYREVQSYLTGQVDSELQDGAADGRGQLKSGTGGFNGNFGFGRDTPSGTAAPSSPGGDPHGDPAASLVGAAAGTPGELAHPSLRRRSATSRSAPRSDPPSSTGCSPSR